MTLGAEPKKVAILGVLVVVGAVGLYMNFSGDSSPAPAAPAPRSVAAPAELATAKSTSAPRSRTAAGRGAVSEFRIRQGSARPEDKVDPASIDPELRLDLLAKVQAIQPVVAGRNLFQYGAAPPPDTPMPKVPTGVQKIPINQAPQSPPPTVTQNNPPPVSGPPPAAPINLKYYAYVVRKEDGRKVAYLMDGDEILGPVQENQTLKQRYRVVRITLTTIEVEDTQSKSTQTLKIQETT